MKIGLGKSWGLAVTVGLAAVALLVPASSAALDSDLKGSAVFRLQGTNGYQLLVIAASERADGRAVAGVFVRRRGESVLYTVPATVTTTRFEADFGALGRISLDIVPTGAEREFRSRCGGDTVSFEPNLYEGTFEFRGEDGFTEASAARIPEYSRFGLDGVFCPGRFWRESRGPRVPGARLGVRRGKGQSRTSLQFNQNRPGARTLFEAEAIEKRGRIGIQRFVQGRAPSHAFDFDPLLRTATVDPPPPFSGSASFHRNAAPANRWSGNLTVDFPGRADVPLTRPGSRVSLVHAHLQTGRGPISGGGGESARLGDFTSPWDAKPTRWIEGLGRLLPGSTGS